MPTTVKASIIILTLNNLDYTRMCLESILANTRDVSYEIILVENASDDGTPDYLRQFASQHEHVCVIYNQENAGFARGNNQGVAAAQGEYLVFLNNDTVVTPGWLPKLLEYAGRPDAGMVGPVTNGAANEALIDVDYKDLPDMEPFAKRYTENHAGQCFEIEMLLFFCVAMRRAVFDEVGPLDESYGVGMFEDDDYALRIKEKGYKILCVEDVFIHHWGSATLLKMGMTPYWDLFKQNRLKFEEKWNRRWMPHQYRPGLERLKLLEMVNGTIWLADHIAKLDQVLAETDKKAANLWKMVQDRDAEINRLNEYIYNVSQTKGWIIISFFWHILNRLMPPGTGRARLFNKLMLPLDVLLRWGPFELMIKIISKLLKTPPGRIVASIIGVFIPKSTREFWREMQVNFPLVDRSSVILFASPDVLPWYGQRHELKVDPGKQPIPIQVSLISTEINEADNARAWLESLLQQARRPDEVVIVDGGSQDNTVEIIREFARTFPIPIKLIEAPGANISKGRNIAIRNATHPVIAAADFGCVLDVNWLRYLVLPFEVNPDIQVSAGYSRTDKEHPYSRICTGFFMPDLDTADPAIERQANPQTFLPSSRSLAFKKGVWARAGGYPEWLSDAGEDTLFNFQVKMQPIYWAFVPQALVTWIAPKSMRKVLKTYFRYAQGDGEVGMFQPLYWQKLKLLGASIMKWTILLAVSLVVLGLLWGQVAWWAALGTVAALALLGAVFMERRLRWRTRKFDVSYTLALHHFLMPYFINLVQMRGYCQGVANRPRLKARQLEPFKERLQQILDEHPERKGIIVYPPSHDWGFMFQLPHQMARALARMGYLYFYWTKNEMTDAVVGFYEVEPNLYLTHVPQEVFQILKDPIVYVGTPWNYNIPALFENPKIVYDHYDIIEIFSANPAHHEQLLRQADVVMVTAGSLQENIKVQRPDALFAPNAVDYSRIRQLQPGPEDPIPADLAPILAKGKPLVGYSGVLSERFDYEMMLYLAKNRLKYEFVLIGANYDRTLDRSGILDAGLPNLHWLDMKEHDELFKYVYRFDVGIIPFKINKLTIATTSIKMFEYMACGKPVVSTAMPESKKYAGVLIAETCDQLVKQVDMALSLRKDAEYLATIDKTAQANTWERRAEKMIGALNDSTRRKN